MKINGGKLELRFLDNIQIKFNLVCNLHVNYNSQKSVSSFYEDNFEPCLPKHLLTKLKFWCEWGIISLYINAV